MKKKNASAAAELLTVRDFVRYAVSRFNEEKIFYGHGTDNAFDEAVFLVLDTLSLPIEQLEPYYDARLLAAERMRLFKSIEARAVTRKPVSYITNRAWLKGVPFYVDERVIVPRSYLGEMIGRVLSGEDENFLLMEDMSGVGRVLDLCTGSGCLAIMAAYLFEGAEVDAVDLSKDALDVAKINVKDHGLQDRVHLYKGDLFQPLKGKKYDLIITNPPYVDAAGMSDLPQEYAHEPRMALAAGKDGLDIVRRILKEAPAHLNPGGVLLCEVGESGAIMNDAFPDLPFLWLDTETSEGEVFCLTREQLVKKGRRAAAS